MKSPSNTHMGGEDKEKLEISRVLTVELQDFDYFWCGSARACNALQHTTTHCNTLQHTATQCNTLQHTTTHCNTLHHNATHRNTLQHTATLCNTLHLTTKKKFSRVLILIRFFQNRILTARLSEAIRIFPQIYIYIYINIYIYIYI